MQKNLKTSELPGWDFVPKGYIRFPGAGTGHRVSRLILGRCPAELEAFQRKADSCALKGNILLELHNLRVLPLALACMSLSQHRGLRSTQKEKSRLRQSRWCFLGKGREGWESNFGTHKFQPHPSRAMHQSQRQPPSPHHRT